MTFNVGEQVQWCDLDGWSGKMSQELSAATEEKTLRQCSKKRSKSSNRKPPPIPVPDKGWPSAGCLSDVDGRWSIAWRVHDAQFWGVPQRRKRIALVCDFGGMSAPKVLFERKGLRGDTAEGGTAREGFAETQGKTAIYAEHCKASRMADSHTTAFIP